MPRFCYAIYCRKGGDSRTLANPQVPARDSHVASLLGMTREGGTRKLGAAPLRMGKAPKFVIASLAEQGAAISQYRPEHGKAPAKSKVPT